jgi:threonine/homoserine/homoserine lactone efflux protein
MIGEFVLASLIIEMTPGPNMGYLAVLAARRGRSAGLAAVAGVALGLALAGTAAALGLVTLMSTMPVVYEVVRWAGVAYMVYLAWEAWVQPSPLALDGEFANGPLRSSFLRGLITNLLNPKAYLFYAVILPEFVDPHSPLAAQVAILTALYVAVATGVHAAIVVGFGTFSRLIADERRYAAMRAVFSLLLLAMAGWLAWSTAR